jgi:hypothetical protein
MKAILGALVAIVILFFAVPMLAGGSTNVCKDVESHDVKTTASTITGTNSGPVYNVINSVGQAGATGEVEQTKQANLHPDVPTVVSCSADFWQSL